MNASLLLRFSATFLDSSLTCWSLDSGFVTYSDSDGNAGVGFAGEAFGYGGDYCFSTIGGGADGSSSSEITLFTFLLIGLMI